MKKLIVLILLVFCVSAARGENVSLTFSSAAGEETEFLVRISDPSILSYTSRRVYDDPDHNSDPDRSFREIISFEGLIPGETSVAVSARSPLGDNYDADYQVTVDEELNVILAEVWKLVQLRLIRGGMFVAQQYDLCLFENEYLLFRNGGLIYKTGSSLADRLVQVIDEYDILSWDGFYESDPYVLDGEDFSFSAVLSSGESVHAWGTNAFPPNYFRAVGEIQAMLEEAGTGDPETIYGTYIYEGEGFGGGFTITINEDETWSFSEGPLSSYNGGGVWSRRGMALTLYEMDGKYLDNYFTVGYGMLIFSETGSDNFPYVKVPDGGKFIKK